MTGTTHRLLRNRLVAHLELDEMEHPVAVVIPFACGDRVRMESVADVDRLIRTLQACRDGMRPDKRRTKGPVRHVRGM